jgi:hypothetical protein
MWLSTDPALGEYVPGAPVDDEARKRNQSLSGMGGVFNTVNLHLYHYAGNNPVKYTDPEGREVKYNKNGKTDIYVKYEDAIENIEGQMLSPGGKYPDSGNKRIDGVITYNENTGEVVIYKINDSESSPLSPVNLKVKQSKDGTYKFSMGLWSGIKNWLGGLLKGKDEVKSGKYSLDKLPENSPLRDWYNTAQEQQSAVQQWEADRQAQKEQSKHEND